MATSKLSKEEQMRFLEMAKQFNWNLSNISTQQTFPNSNKEQENINNASNHIDVNNSFADSEATESEDDPFRFKKREESEKQNKKQYDSLSNHHIQSSINDNHSTLWTNIHNDKHAKSSSLSLTKENLSHFNTSLDQNENKSINSFSSSSVLSKHNFALLEISSSDDQKENSIGKTHTKRNGFIDLCSSDEEDLHSKENNLISSFTEQIQLKKDIKKRKKITKQKKILKTTDINQRLHSNANSHILCNQILNKKQYTKEREQYTLCFFHRLNENAFESKLTLNDNVTYSWCKTLNKTAGDCRLITKNKTRKAHIRLATKVLDTLERLKQTLCHEMCHAMAWIVHSNRKPPHGKHFKYWANKAELAFHDIRVTTCHNYKIQFKFQWKCTECQYVYGRHSKSIKPETHRCGVCKGKLEFLGRLKPDGTFAKIQKKKQSAFTVFMKQNMSAIKKQFPGAKHGDVMKILSEKYKLSKNVT